MQNRQFCDPVRGMLNHSRVCPRGGINAVADAALAGRASPCSFCEVLLWLVRVHSKTCAEVECGVNLCAWNKAHPRVALRVPLTSPPTSKPAPVIPSPMTPMTTGGRSPHFVLARILADVAHAQQCPGVEPHQHCLVSARCAETRAMIAQSQQSQASDSPSPTPTPLQIFQSHVQFCSGCYLCEPKPALKKLLLSAAPVPLLTAPLPLPTVAGTSASATPTSRMENF